ncbi:MAG: CHAT domain-containing protein [Limnobacter sp.]|nr:CHAT domain-containing protein [Limnobacter sp.]
MAKRQDIGFVIPGSATADSVLDADGGDAVLRSGRSKGAVRLGARRGAGESVRLVASPGEDVVVLGIDNGPTLVLHPENARDLMLSQDTRSRSASRGAAEVEVPAQLGWPGLEQAAGQGATRGAPMRGWLGRVVLRSFEVITGIAKDNAANMLAATATRRLDGRVDAGVYRLGVEPFEALKTSGRKLDTVSPGTSDRPLLVLVHGTFVDTASTFGQLWRQHPQRVEALFEHYRGRVFALDHPTLGESPIGNALTLLRAMPDEARLHLLTHSRGGLVAEALARASAGRPLGKAEIALFDGPALANHRAELEALYELAARKRLRIERVVRVACPARGTLLASTRLDAYLSVLRWGLQVAGIAVLPEFVDFLAEVARRRADPRQLPGLEAMMPGSAVIQWLNRAEAPLPGELRVVAGDAAGDTLGAWIKTLLADAFFWTDNDLVVQTRSMYGGTPRGTAEPTSAGAAAAAPQAGNAASFVLDRGDKVTHFGYFANESTAAAICNGLIEDAPPEFQPIGPLSAAGKDPSGSRAEQAVRRSRGPGDDGRPASERPAVVVLPGILGSNLALDGDRIWLGWRFVNGLKRLQWEPERDSRVTPDGPVGAVYDELLVYLADSHEVVPFAFDWRRPIEDEARRLADTVDALLDARAASGQPVRLLAHSLGGLVARTMQLERPQTWQRMIAHPQARLLMLGTPNGGSWAPMQVLTGDDTFGNLLAAIGALFDDSGSREVMAGMPGFLQLQAGLLDPVLELSQESTWQTLAKKDIAFLEERNHWHQDGQQLAVYRWSAPPQPILDRAVALRRRLDEQAASLASDAERMLLVVGRSRFTPDGFRMGLEGLEYLDAVDGGDGRVTLASAQLPGVATWQCRVAHGDLPKARDAFDAYLELLSEGRTDRLPALPTGVRRGGVDEPPILRVPSRPSRGLSRAEPPTLDPFAGEPSAAERRRQRRGLPSRLPVTVVNGNLVFVSRPLLLGHYESTALTGVERVADSRIGGTMAEALQAGLYPSQIGTHQVFVNTRHDPARFGAIPRPPAVIVVGLGEEGALRHTRLSEAVRQAVIAWAQRESERGAGGASTLELAATLLGSGGSGIDPGGAAQAVAAGVAEANRRLKHVDWPLVGRLQLIELYLDRATEAHRALTMLAESRPGEFSIDPTIEVGNGAHRQPADGNYRGAGHDFVTAIERDDPRGRSLIEYTLDTRRARSEVRGSATQPQLVERLLEAAAASATLDAQTGRSLFQLLVPVELRPFLSGSTAVVMQLDQRTARYPWELLDTPEGAEEEPWAVRTSLIRKLRTEDFRRQPVAAGSEGRVVVIGEPQCDRSRFAELPAARAEAEAVATIFDVQPLLGPDALAAVNAVLDGPLRVLHIAGHGEHHDDGTGGVILSGGAVLGPREMAAMERVPELVFVNCCYTGQVKPESGAMANALGVRRLPFAASLAEQLILNGVRCVVAAGWAVEDTAAKVFAQTFYERLKQGERFVDAVGAARRAAWLQNRGGNTWAAYQCYGDPDWRYEVPVDGRPRAVELPSVVSAPALARLLESEAIDAQFEDPPGPARNEARGQRLERIRALEARYAGSWGGKGAVAEAFGRAYAQSGDTDAAMRWYRAATSAADGGASLAAVEQLINLDVRDAEKTGDAEDRIRAAIERLERLIDLGATVERYSLLGSAWKRIAMIAAREGEPGEESVRETDALRQMLEAYGRAEELARTTSAANLYYPALNRIAAELRLAFLKGRLPSLDDARLAQARESLESQARHAPDFWSVAAQAELRLLEALAAGRLADAVPDIEAAWEDLNGRVPAPHCWDSVEAQARFVLSHYPRVKAGREAAEKKAAQRLLGMLGRYASAGSEAPAVARSARAQAPTSAGPS